MQLGLPLPLERRVQPHGHLRVLHRAVLTLLNLNAQQQLGQVLQGRQTPDRLVHAPKQLILLRVARLLLRVADEQHLQRDTIYSVPII